MSDLLQQIGLTQQEIQERVIDRIVVSMTEAHGCDEDGNETGPFDSKFKRELDKRVELKINETISKLFEAHVAPNIESLISTFTLQQTNSWGEKTGNPVTFTEYLVQRADAYVREEVDSSGQSRKESSSSYWSKSTTRIAFMIDKYLQYNIQNAMKEAMQTANSSIAKGIEEAVKMKLAELLNGIKCSASVGK